MIRQKVQLLSMGGYDDGRSCTDRRMKEVILELRLARSALDQGERRNAFEIRRLL